MSSCNQLLDLQEQICYVQCGFCTTILLVSVPCTSLLQVVTVRCGHCTGLLSVNMMRASFVPLHLLASLQTDQSKQNQDVCHEELDLPNPSDKQSPPLISFQHEDDDEEDEEEIPVTPPPVINKPPEKRQRAPSAYNRFIKEEIQRLKAREPNITHKEAFSTAAKNWAHFPRIQHRDDGESCSHGGGKVVSRNSYVGEMGEEDGGLHQRMTLPWMQYQWSETQI